MSSAALDAAEAATSREPTETELDEANHELDDAKHHHGINVSAGMEHWGKPGHLTETEKAKLQEFQKAEPKLNNVQVCSLFPFSSGVFTPHFCSWALVQLPRCSLCRNSANRH